MEAGNRCFDDHVPEEVNRRLIDHSSAILMPYTHRSPMQNLVSEGIERRRIYVTGNPIFEVLQKFAPVYPGSRQAYSTRTPAEENLLSTMHRAENVATEATA